MNQSSNKGYKFSTQKNNFCVNHLLLIDDFKVYSSTEAQMKTLVGTIEIFANSIGLNFGLDKCATQNNINPEKPWKNRSFTSIKNRTSKRI